MMHFGNGDKPNNLEFTKHNQVSKK